MCSAPNLGLDERGARCPSNRSRVQIVVRHHLHRTFLYNHDVQYDSVNREDVFVRRESGKAARKKDKKLGHEA